ncbi:MAG: hypothetical protein OEL76_02020 [Siculibacillus sp.]|nr:hypothetical protein [Siculibacillus sp.]
MPPSAALWRFVVASLGFIAAMVTSLAVVFLAISLKPTLNLAAGDVKPAVDGALAGLGEASLLFPILIRGVWPLWLVLIMAGEFLRLRALAAPLFGFPALAAAAVLTTIETPPGDLLRVLAAAGLVAGFVHWLIAGRGAGISMRSGQDSSEGGPRPPHA